MLVVADTSPINYLLLIDAIDLLPRMYHQILLPRQVIDELSRAPEIVRQWVASPPRWIQIQEVPTPWNLPDLDIGEAAAIALAHQLHADLLLIDEQFGRGVAARAQIPIIGTLGVLKDASIAGLIDFPTAIHSLLQTTFRVSPPLIQKMLDEDANRRK